MQNNFWNRRLPTVFGVLFLTLSIGTIGWLSSNAVLFGTQAAADPTPKNVKISNISDSSFTVSFVTDEPVESSLSYGKTQPPNQVMLDDRDQQSGTVAKHSTHHITVKNLDPATKYFFVIASGGENFLINELPYEVTTLSKADTPPSPMVVTGKVTTETGTPPQEALVYASINASQLASGLVDATGAYSFDVSVLGVTPESVLSLLIVDSTRESKISLAGNQINPVPLVILSKNYDFLLSTDPLEETEEASESAEVVSFPTSAQAADAKPQILTPDADQEFKDQQPVFRGTALPNTDVEITIESENPITTTVKSGSSGTWSFRPDTKLAPGTHTITIRTIDASGIIRTLTQSFVVYAEGSQFTEPSVSPSAGATTPTNTPTPTQSQPTMQPTATRTPTPTTIQVTQTETTTVTISPTQVPIPVTGNATMLVTIVGIISAVAIGALLFMLTAV